MSSVFGDDDGGGRQAGQGSAHAPSEAEAKPRTKLEEILLREQQKQKRREARERGEGPDAAFWRQDGGRNGTKPRAGSGWLQVGLVVQVAKDGKLPEAGKKLLVTKLVEGGAVGELLKGGGRVTVGV